MAVLSTVVVADQPVAVRGKLRSANEVYVSRLLNDVTVAAAAATTAAGATLKSRRMSYGSLLSWRLVHALLTQHFITPFIPLFVESAIAVFNISFSRGNKKGLFRSSWVAVKIPRLK